MRLKFVIAGEVTTLLANVHTKNNKHCKQGQSEKKCHSNSVYLFPSYPELVKMHLRSS